MKNKGILFRLNVIYAIILIVLIIVTSIVFASIGESAFNFKEPNRKDISEVYDIDNLKKISVDVDNADVNVVGVDKEEVNVMVTGNRSGDMIVENKNGILKIKEKLWFAFLDFSVLFNREEKLQIEILVPKNFGGNIEIDVVSGNITGTSLVTENIEIDAVSAKIDFTDINFGEINIDTISSAVALKNISGNVIDITQVSGDSFIALKTLPKEINADTVSGRIDISVYEVKEKKEFDIDFDTVSGNLIVDPVVSINSNSNHSINVDTVSGNLQVR